MIKIRRNFKGSGGKPQRIKEGEKQRNLFYLQKFCKIKNHPAKIGSSCEKNLQGKEPSYENEVILRKWGHLVKNFRKQKSQVTKIFTAANHPPGTHVPFHNLQSPFCSYKMSCEIPKAKFCMIRLQVVKIFAAAIHPPGTRVPFRSLQNPFHNCEMSCKFACEISIKLWNGPLATKMSTVIWIPI